MMMGNRKPLFIRRGWQIVPASRFGWIAMLSYVLIVAGGSIALSAWIPAAGEAIAIAWVAVVVASALLFTLWAWRLAEVIAPPPHRDGDYWFVPKLFGLGATPVTWQGWALVLGAMALLILDVRFVAPDLVKIVLAITLIVALIGIAAHKTAGGWGWRWGARD
jgi:hypothetical protein